MQFNKGSTFLHNHVPHSINSCKGYANWTRKCILLVAKCCRLSAGKMQQNFCLEERWSQTYQKKKSNWNPLRTVAQHVPLKCVYLKVHTTAFKAFQGPSKHIQTKGGLVHCFQAKIVQLTNKISRLFIVKYLKYRYRNILSSSIKKISEQYLTFLLFRQII